MVLFKKSFASFGEEVFEVDDLVSDVLWPRCVFDELVEDYFILSVVGDPLGDGGGARAQLLDGDLNTNRGVVRGTSGSVVVSLAGGGRNVRRTPKG